MAELQRLTRSVCNVCLVGWLVLQIEDSNAAKTELHDTADSVDLLVCSESLMCAAALAGCMLYTQTPTHYHLQNSTNSGAEAVDATNRMVM
jgi:hypothetical protein